MWCPSSFRDNGQLLTRAWLWKPFPVLSPRASCICPAPLPYKLPAPSSVSWDPPSSLGSLRGAVSIALTCSSPFSRPKFLSHKRADGLIHELTKVWRLPVPLHLGNLLALKSLFTCYFLQEAVFVSWPGWGPFLVICRDGISDFLFCRSLCLYLLMFSSYAS